MDLSLFKTSIISMGLLGAAFAGGLTIASVKLAVDVDPRVEEIEEALPGANCGACGEPGCSSFAESVVGGSVGINDCPVADSEVADQIAGIMGIDNERSVKNVARVLCCGGNKETFARSEYQGIQTCKAADIVSNGNKSCVYGCLGFGDCAEICPFGAIEMNENGLPVIIDEECTGCRNCVDACPKAIIILAAEDKEVHIKCSSNGEGKAVKEVCKAGCIGCGICVKKCPVDTITMEDNLAVLEYEDCINCQACVKACPMDTIEVIETDTNDSCCDEAEEPELEVVSSDSEAETAGDSSPEGETRDSSSSETDEAEKEVSSTDNDECSVQITDECSGCTVCVEECPVDAITGEAGERHVIDPDICIECENCVDVCPTEAIVVDE